MKLKFRILIIMLLSAGFLSAQSPDQITTYIKNYKSSGDC